MLCVVLICKGHSGDGRLSSLILFKYESSRGHIWFLHLIRSFSYTYTLWFNSIFWKNLRSVLLDKDSMIHSIVSYRQIDTSDYCGHVPLVVILYVLSEVYNVLVHDFQVLKPACFLMRCPSTIGATYVSSFIELIHVA